MIIFAVGFGLIFGSFLSVLLARLGRKEGIVAGRSECPHCHHTLSWYDLIPLASYGVLAGKCRYCGVRISKLYPVLELSVAISFGLYVVQYGMNGFLDVTALAMLFGLIALFFFDLQYQILPDIITFSLVVLAVIRLAAEEPSHFVGGLVTGGVLAGMLGLLYIFSHGRWLGLGDVKLGLLIGILFGYPVAVGVTLVAVWVGALWGITLMIAGRATMKTALPFGSFWTAAAIITVLWPGPVMLVSSLFIPAM